MTEGIRSGCALEWDREEIAVPLRDHFRPPVSKRSSWQGFHGFWPAAMVQNLVRQLPGGYVAEPRAQLGTYFEIDVCAFDENVDVEREISVGRASNGGVATATWAPPEPTLTLDAEIPDQYEYEVLIYDADRDRTLVAAVEIVSPANKDRPDNRLLFVAKCASLLTKGVCVSIVDLVTIRHFNLYADLLALIGRSDPTLGATPPATYATTCRRRKAGRRTKLELWSYPLVVGQPLPRLPIWLTETHAVSLDLEASYEETCRALRIV
ncbi:MAG TPA: DUF4058 family protein [Gemmataceae bacterium]|jgi:hypothetical protein|nr:DUF4058 family protein [Gemmataceae bacterium]